MEGWPSARENVRAAPSVMRGLRREGTKNLQISGPYSIETERLEAGDPWYDVT